MLQILRGSTQIRHYPSQEVALQRVQGDIDDSVVDLRKFGRDIHTLEDVGFKDAPGPHNRSPVRLLGPTMLILSAAAVGLGVLAAKLAGAAFAGGGAWGILGVLAAVVAVALFAFALYTAVFGIVAWGTGHPTYKTQHGGWSNWFSHAADRAFSDPDANTKELWRVYELLKKAAKAADPNAVANDAIARKAIKETVHADTPAKIDKLFNTPARDSKGNLVPSYSQIRTHAPFSRRPPDVSLDGGPCLYDPKFTTCRVR